jgi:hypothetical protein
MAALLKRIEELLKYLPKRDYKIANYYLLNRDWQSLLEIVNSDIYLAEKHQTKNDNPEWESIQVDELHELRATIEEFVVTIYGELDFYSDLEE